MKDSNHHLQKYESKQAEKKYLKKVSPKNKILNLRKIK